MAVPKYLFRYRNNDNDHFWDDLEKAIIHRKFYLGRASDQNDPFEANPTITKANIAQIEEELKKRFGSNPIINKKMAEEKEGRKLSRQEFRRKYKSLKANKETARKYDEAATEMLKGLPERAGLASFSTASDCPLMWGLYANSHKGVALCFEQHFDEHVEGDLLPLEVQYQETRPALSAAEYARINEDNLALAEEISRKTLLIKSSAWQHENEWRLFDSSGKNRRYVSANSLKPAGLIFGCNTSSEVIEKAVRRFSDYIPFYKCEISKDSFEIKHRELEVIIR